MYYTTYGAKSGGARGIADRGQIYMGALIGVVEIHLCEIAAQVTVLPRVAAPSPPPPPFAPPLGAKQIYVNIIYFYIIKGLILKN